MNNFNWWTELTHGGIFISNPVLHEVFDETTVEPWNWKYKRLRDHYNTYLSKVEFYRAGSHPVHAWITDIFEDFLGHNSKNWLKGSSIPQSLSTLTTTGLPNKPTRVLVDDGGRTLLLLKRDESPRLGMHKGRRSYAYFVDLLRKTHTQIGILTNGSQIRLVYAGLDHDAWVQWQVDAWFDEGETRHQLDGLLTLLHPDNFVLRDDSFKLLDAVITSRNRQADLADVLGGQIRKAVETLTSTIGRKQQVDSEFLDPVQITPGTDSILSEPDTLNAIYQAATRLIMRKVVLFYAEAKELLPNYDPFYHNNYSLEGLYAQLLSAVQHAGEEELKTRYSAWQRFLALSNMVHKGSEHETLPLKAYGGTLFKQGNPGSPDPVLRALGLFERANLGISDFEVFHILRLIKIGKTKVRQGRGFTYVSGPVDFGDLRTEYIGMMYEGLLDYELKRVSADDPRIILNIGDQPILSLSLLEPMDDKAIKNLFENMKVAKDKVDASEESDEVEPDEEMLEETENLDDDSTTYGKSLQWALHAVEVARLVNRPRGAAAQELFNEKKLKKARSLIVDVLEPGEMYLARWGGTRKGSGTFYTKPSLAVPTTQRTLKPLVYDVTKSETKVKDPKAILGLRICDPSVGSGTFLVAAARYLTEVLYESVLSFILTKRDDEGNVVIKPNDSIVLSKDLRFEAPPIKPSEDGWEEQMKARLKRLIVEHCLFGVDLNGMAVELARLALWLETMDKDLPFEFLDHRIKQGNSLVGTWFKNHLDYPIRAWEREGGDGPKGELSKEIKRLFASTIKPQMADWLTRFSSQTSLLKELKLEDQVLEDHLESWALLNKTALFDTEMREEIFYTDIGQDKKYNQLKRQFDRWIAIWFWPIHHGSNNYIFPSNFNVPDSQIDEIVSDLKARYHFFHWELEFPEVFILQGGFNALLGNPPWNTLQPESLEFFSNYDPIYRTYGKQEALHKQKIMFESEPAIQREWISYTAYFNSISNYIKSSVDLFKVSLGRGRENSLLVDRWKSFHQHRRRSYLSGETPYRHQGTGKIDLYQLFLELSYQLLVPGGRLGMIAPSGLYTDKGNTDLRHLFLSSTNWEWLYVFENKEKIFDIHRSFKFGPLLLTKGGETEAIKCAFMRHDVKDWESTDPPHMEIPVDKIRRFSPNTLSLMEFKSPMDLQICEKIYGDRPLLGDELEDGWNVKFSQEFNMTSHSHLFTSRVNLERMGLISEREDARDPRVRVSLWKRGYVPLWEGYLIYQHDSGYNSSPRNFLRIENCSNRKRIKWGWRDVSRSTDQRTFIAAKIPSTDSGNTIWTVYTKDKQDMEKLTSIVNSFCIDFVTRLKQSGYHLLKAVVINIPVLSKQELAGIPSEIWQIGQNLTAKERLKKRINQDVIIAELLNLTITEMQYLVKTFPLVDKSLPAVQRQTSITLEAFKYLKNVGLSRFLKDGWQLPDYVTKFDRPGITIWEPEGGWEKAWSEAKSQLSEEEWIEFVGDGLSVEGNSGGNQIDEPAQQGLF